MYIKKFILFCILILLLLPAIQNYFSIIKLAPLKGSFSLTDKPNFSQKTWFTGEYQKQYDEYLEDHIGFRKFFIRSYNQIKFSFYHIINAKNTVIGKNDILYQDYYIKAYLGQDFVGYEIIKKNIKKIAFVQNELEKRNVFLFFLIAPGKASFFPDYFPPKYDKIKKTVSNYDVFIEEMNNNNINYIDFRNYFLSIKDTTRYPLFPKCGTHWSGYGVTLVVDSLVKYMEKTKNIDMSGFYSNGGELRDKNLLYSDADIGKALNFHWDIPSNKLYYPNIIFENDTNKIKPNLLSVGDSFAQSLINGFYPFFPNIFDENTNFWFYNQRVHYPPHVVGQNSHVPHLNLKEQIEQRDFIMIGSTEHNLVNFGFGFIDDLYELFTTNTNTKHEKIMELENQIRNNPEWLNLIRRKAKKRNITVEEMITIDANYMYKQKYWDTKDVTNQ
ncbi:MAG: hypothetical protein K8R58_09525 [Bacteroidales bacterium]|nr:hypothetical protein [Bacteroidales bacterium]